ncbi:helix-turn-helix domain-containing protein [Alteribacillus persepolensis]|nr:helix-turn-helix domain-containing protein [Alteribacillus persepolensis]
MYGVGEVIRDLREYLGLSQAEVCKGVCSQSEISKIERGIVIPYITTFTKIAENLGIEPSYLLLQAKEKEIEYVHQVKSDINYLINDKQFNELKHKLKLLKEEPIFKKSEYRNYLEWVSALIIYYQDKNIEKSLHIINSLIPIHKKINAYNQQDLSIINSKAIIISSQGKIEEGIKIFELINRICKYPKGIDIKFIIKNCYNLSKSYSLVNKYKDSLYFANKGIRLNIDHEMMIVLGELLYQKSNYYQVKGNKNKAVSLINAALTIFELKDDKNSANKIKELKFTMDKD